MRTCILQTLDPPGYKQVENAYALLNLGDSVTTDHISPAGSIARTSPAARYLASKGLVSYKEVIITENHCQSQSLLRLTNYDNSRNH